MEATRQYLIVDDSASVRKHLAYLLKLALGTEEGISEAVNAPDGYRAFRKVQPGVVFLDMMMPKQEDGLAALRAILREKPETRIVIVTALQRDHPAVMLCIGEGAIGYLRKPLTVRGLQEVLDEIEAQSGRFRRVG